MFTLRSAFKKICAVDNYFRGCNVAKGQLLLSHVVDAVQFVGDDIVLAKGKCVSQVKDDVVYDVELELSWSCPLKRELRISCGKCTCIAGVRGQCKHAVAVCLYINSYEEDSCTSRPQQWGKPSAKPRMQRSQHLSDVVLRKKSTAPDIKIVPRTTLMSYPEIDCPLKEVLELMQLSADEVTCREVLDTVVEQMASGEEASHQQYQSTPDSDKKG
ncbi:uncharacterized protein LOC125941297 [Dermacentor silvarum]|uniref:uncharacterized protein LOC125941297 n=1 Tax=Dermacentor silvarum TaxID=543639 RepID=UPI002100ED1A|nr:uncharacterized protein LOC125941297 [Dermacentor silvarum]